jgi:hypothetical protein
MLQPQSLTFASIPAGSISNAQMVTVTNSGTTPLTISGFDLTGTALPEYSFQSSCVLPLMPGEMCLINVSFTPTVVGPHKAQLLVMDDAPNSPQAIALVGDAIAPYSISSVGPAAASVTAGQTALYQLQLTPQLGFIGSVQVLCAGAPAGTTCVAKPASVPLTQGTGDPMKFALTVATQAPGGTAAAATHPGTYLLTVTATWGVFSTKTALNLTVQ